VIGLAGGVPIPNISETGNTGVYGAGTTGVSGQGITASGRGGMFKSTHSAQVQLVPQPLPITFMSPVTETSFTRIPAGNESNETLQLPRDGQGGDLLTLMDNQRQCTLWFCVRGALRGADGNITSDAEWAQVLLGPSFKGSR
jgi:hypothetical protein